MEVLVEDGSGRRRYKLPLEPEVEIDGNGWINLRFIFRNCYHRRPPQERQSHLEFLGHHYPLPPIPKQGAEYLGQKERWDYNIAHARLVQDVLTERQQQILQLLANGAPDSKSVAAKLGISRATVDSHIYNARARLTGLTGTSVRSRAEAVAIAWQAGLIE